MTPDPYDHVREAFHVVADGLMEWKEPPERGVRDSDALGASYRTSDIPALERIAERLTRDGHIREAVELWALALRIRAAHGEWHESEGTDAVT